MKTKKKKPLKPNALQKKSPISKSSKQSIRKPRRKRKADIQTGDIIKLSVGGLGLILLAVLLAKFVGSSEKPPLTVVDNTAKPVSTVDDKSNPASTADNKSKPVSTVENKSNPVEEVAEKSEAPAETVEYVVPFAPAQNTNTEINEEYSKPEFAKEDMKNVKISIAKYDEVKEEVAKATPRKNMILIPSEEEEMNELRKLDTRDITEEERKRLNYLMNKYNWYRSMRYQYSSREELDLRWSQRHESIEQANNLAKSRSDSLLRRPLQILLEGITDPKERAYRMRIYQKPISFKEKEMVRKAKAQAEWERRRAEGPKKYPEDKGKKKGIKKIYTDEYGYKYYLDQNGNRIYLDE